MTVSPGKGNGALKVLLADDHLETLERVKKVLNDHGQVIAAVSNGLMALEAAKALSPDLIVLDIQMPGMDGFRAAQEMRRVGLKARIVFLSTHCGADFIAAARAVGNGYVWKPRMAKDLPRAIEESRDVSFFASHP
jgi:CheY-like chemotaxis protein